MEIKLHANARLTPKSRRYIQESNKSVRELSRELNVNETTIRRWKSRNEVTDRSHRPHNLCTNMKLEEEEVIIELRQRLRLSLNDITEVIKRCVGNYSRSAIYRCLKRRNAMLLPKLEGENKNSVGKFEDTEFGYVHIDLKYIGSFHKVPGIVFVAIERSTRFVYVELIRSKDSKTITECLGRFIDQFPGKVHTILTDNGSEFTDRFAGFGESRGRVRGNHRFDVFCKAHGIKHKLTRPFRPQTNGMVERFNRRISEAIDSRPKRKVGGHMLRFGSVEERDKFIMTFVKNYNNTRLGCLDYKSPNEMLHNLSEQNT